MANYIENEAGNGDIELESGLGLILLETQSNPPGSIIGTVIVKFMDGDIDVQ